MRVFSYSIYALFEAIEKNELFKTQTEIEFEILAKVILHQQAIHTSSPKPITNN